MTPESSREKAEKEELFFEVGSDEEFCYDRSFFEDELCYRHVETIKLRKAKCTNDGDAFWCMKEGETIEKGSDTCGKLNCQHYKPRNGKNGICKEYRLCRVPHGPVYELSEKGLVEVKP